MDLHKIIHNTLHEFIQTYIPDADLRFVISFFQPFKINVKFGQFYIIMCFCNPIQHTGWCSSVLHHWGPRGSWVPPECWRELWCGGLCWNAWSLHTWLCWNWQVVNSHSFLINKICYLVMALQRCLPSFQCKGLWDDVQPGFKAGHCSDPR